MNKCFFFCYLPLGQFQRPSYQMHCLLYLQVGRWSAYTALPWLVFLSTVHTHQGQRAEGLEKATGRPGGEVRLKGARCSPRCRSRGDGPLEVKGYVPVGKDRGKGVARVLPGVRVPQHHYCAPLPSALMVAGGNGLGRKGRLCMRSLLSGSSSCSLSAV